MGTLLQVIGVILMIQGGGPLVQRLLGRDPEGSFFLGNWLGLPLPVATVGFVAIGLLVFVAGLRMGKKRGARR
ncbi:hypothetical protein EV191_101986 [Tamaricihabitans halophyticus]|uniref:Uncharacterized protein n=1 Tax=Tamaricihabitans halophyticus TaxID=1262583 RepID=A0A4R2R515_9PSEU|nr:hypothetical protein [Tamaricihabitans halophyticus]TCP57034.1 hypothetical protein EV191_101986 [Tamaricihabitans halophyticus]